MVGPLRVVVSPFRPTSRIEGRDSTTTLRRRDVGAVGFVLLNVVVTRTSLLKEHRRELSYNAVCGRQFVLVFRNRNLLQKLAFHIAA